MANIALTPPFAPPEIIPVFAFTLTVVPKTATPLAPVEIVPAFARLTLMEAIPRSSPEIVASALLITSTRSVARMAMPLAPIANIRPELSTQPR